MTKFKVGDRVRRIVRDRDLRFKIGDIGIIKEVDSTSVPYLINGDWNIEKFLELVEEPMFKVGDKVICIDAEGMPGAGWTKGYKFIIDKINRVDKNAIGDGNCYFPKGECGIFQPHLRLVESTITNVESSEKTKMDIETLKTFNTDNLVVGKEMAEEEMINIKYKQLHSFEHPKLVFC